MSGGLFTRAVAREVGRPLTANEVEAIQARHGQLFRELLPKRRPLPAAVELLAELRAGGVPFGIATSGRRPEIDASLETLALGPDAVVVARGDVERAKPEPDLFLACARSWESRRRSATSSAMPSGICSPHAGRGCSASVYSAAATARTS